MAASQFLRLPRLQFSLRGLLMFMLVVGMGIVVYRWPWEVETISPEHGVRTITRYRRSWNGTPVKHGMEVMGDLQHYGWERWYDAGELRIEKSWRNGVVGSESRYRDGRRHGLYSDDLGHGSQVHGEYRHGKKQGEWKYATPRFVSREQWRDDEKHGRTHWVSRTGQLLQSAEYERGRLTKWNDQPVGEELQRWLTANVPDPAVHRMLLMPIKDTSDVDVRFMPYGEVALRVGAPGQTQQELVVYMGKPALDYETDWSGRLLGETLLAQSLEHWQTFAYRFNMLSTVPISAQSLDWQDRTAVYDVLFEEGSEQELFWLRKVVADPLLAEFPATRFRQILGASDNSPIDVDVTAVADAVTPPLTSGPSKLRSWIPRVRRDLVGQHLDREGCYVEQAGDTLVIKRHVEGSERSRRPKP